MTSRTTDETSKLDFDTIHPADPDSAERQNPEAQGVSPVDTTSMPRRDDFPEGVPGSPDFADDNPLTKTADEPHVQTRDEKSSARGEL
jgi:hypothetical protein